MFLLQSLYPGAFYSMYIQLRNKEGTTEGEEGRKDLIMYKDRSAGTILPQDTEQVTRLCFPIQPNTQKFCSMGKHRGRRLNGT